MTFGTVRFMQILPTPDAVLRLGKLFCVTFAVSVDHGCKPWWVA